MWLKPIQFSVSNPSVKTDGNMVASIDENVFQTSQSSFFIPVGFSQRFNKFAEF